jgi:hypothetical protein
MESAYGHGIAGIFPVAGAMAAVALPLFLRQGTPLNTKSGLAHTAEDEPAPLRNQRPNKGRTQP